MKYKFGYYVSLFTMFFVVVSCGKVNVDESHPMVVGHTSGTISVTSPIVVRFTDDTHFIKSIVAGESVPASVFKFRPKVQGQAHWLDGRTLEFRPSSPLKYDTEYTVTIAISDLADIENTPSKYTFAVTTVSPSFRTDVGDIKMYQSDRSGVFYVDGTVSTSDYVSPENAAKLLNIHPGKHAASWTHNDRGTVHKFRIDSIYAGKKDSELILNWNGGSIDRDLKYSDTVIIPAKESFRLIGTRVEYSPDFRIVATFSDALASGQRIEDYISMSDGQPLRFVTDCNRIYIYPSSRLVGRYGFVFDAGIRSRDGKRIENREQLRLVFEDIAPSVKFIGSGAILPSASGMKMAFSAVNYGAVDVKVIKIYQNNVLAFLQQQDLDGEWDVFRFGKEVAIKRIVLTDSVAVVDSRGVYSLDLSSIIKPEQGAIYRVMLRGVSPLVAEQRGEYAWVSEEYFGDYETRNDRIRNVIASDLGIIAKAGDDGVVNVYINDIVSAESKSGVNVTVYDAINQPIGNIITDFSGAGVIKTTGIPTLIVAEGMGQRGYLKVVPGKNLAMSAFDISGEAVEHGLRCYMYGERGVWRPGDAIFLTAILSDRNNSLPEGHPIKLEFYNPHGQVVSDLVYRINKSGMYVFHLKTSPDDPTGNWEAVLTVGGDVFRKNIKVETVKPNRLKIDLRLNDKPVLSASDIRADLHTQWLHGATASNLKTTVELKLTKMKTVFEGYEGYSFDDNSKYFYNQPGEIFAGNTSSDGTLSFIKELSELYNAPGMLSAQFVTRVFEQGGDFSIDSYTTRISPYTNYVGIRKQGGNGYADGLECGEKQVFEIVTVDAAGKPVSQGGVKAEIIKMDWSWWWNSSSEDGLAAYSADSYYTPIYTTEISTVGGRGKLEYTWEGDSYGWYFIRVTDPSGHSANEVCYVDWGDGSHNASGAGSFATMLTLSADKENYKVGDMAVVTFPSADGARALVTVESGSRVLRSTWINCSGTSTSFDLAVTEDMAPNVYVYVTMLQPYERTANDAPIRMYGVVPIMVENQQSKLEPVLTVPPVIRPEQEFKIKVAEKNKRPMSYTLAIVDEGLLALTRFKTPDPWNSFYSKEALGIRTWDMYDFVIGAYGGRIQQLFTIGGDGEIDRKAASRVQRFKPVVKFLGPFNLKYGETAEHKVQLPPYIGAVRVMVVASDASVGAFGSASVEAEVRKPLMVSQTLPRVMGTGEEVVMPVTVFATEAGVGKVTVEVAESKLFEVVGGKTQSVDLSQKGDKIVFFRLKSSKSGGVGKVTVVASSASDKSTESIEIDVRNPNPRLTMSQMFLIDKGGQTEQRISLPGAAGTNTFNIELSSMPPLNLGSRLQYLVTYPHGCIEQITSGAFPQLYINKLLEQKVAAQSEAHIKSTISRLPSYQTSSGGFSYWMGGREVNTWGTSYAGHFMIEAARLGYSLPTSLKDSWLTFQRNTARQWDNSLGNDLDQAYRLYTLALAGEPERGAMNRMLEMTNIEENSRWLLAGAYALDGKTDIAHRLTDHTAFSGVNYSPFSPDFGTPERDKAVALTVLTIMGEREKAFPIVRELSGVLSSDRWLSTQTTAWLLMSVARFEDTSGGDAPINATYLVDGVKTAVKTDDDIYTASADMSALSGGVPLKIHNHGDGPLYAVVTSGGIPVQGEEREYSDNMAMSVRYSDAMGRPVDPDKIHQGKDFFAEVAVTNTAPAQDYTNLVLTQIFPSGWEIASVTAYGATAGDQYDYRDTRDDRVMTYFGLSNGETKRFRVRLTATYAGRFYMPAVVCGAMYDGSVGAAVNGKWCEVLGN